jgi:hypothetical protein
MNDYPQFSVNGVKLDQGQNMTIWVALQGLLTDMVTEPDSLGTDEHGKFMTKAYARRVREINEICHSTQ